MDNTCKDIVGYKGLYSIDVLGEVINLKTNYIKKNTINKVGYYICNLYKDNIQKTFLIHRLIALHFIDNPNNYPCVNHKDGNKLNNNLDNLEWCSYSHNNKHAFDTGLKSVNEKNKKKFGDLAFSRCKTDPPARKKIVIKDLNNNVIAEYQSIKEAAELNFCHICTIKEALNGRSKQFKDFIVEVKK